MQAVVEARALMRINKELEWWNYLPDNDLEKVSHVTLANLVSGKGGKSMCIHAKAMQCRTLLFYLAIRTPRDEIRACGQTRYRERLAQERLLH